MKALYGSISLRSGCLLWAAALFTGSSIAAEPTAGQLEHFEKTIRPILARNCYNCHSAETKPAGGLRLDDRNGVFTGGDSGPAVVPGEPESSLLLKRVRHSDPKKRMPKEGSPLPDADIAELRAWIQDGAAWPKQYVPSSLSRLNPAYDALRASHWSLQPLKQPPVPAVAKSAWPSDDIDRFVLAKLTANKFAPVADATPGELIRRVTFDLTGLPPTPAEVEQFLKEPSPRDYERVVDRLLKSPQFGERWGRHWLDVARYGESTGPSRNIPYPHAWKYRDYVIDAVNRDVPFDRFIQEQVAGDLLPAATVAERDRMLIATGFLALGPKDVNQRFKVRFIMDNVDEQIDTLTRSVMGMTVSCARCHDHKFDPIPTKDYYALAGIFTSTDNASGVRSKMGGSGLDYYDPEMLVKLASPMPPVAGGQVEQLQASVAAAKKEWDSIRGTPEGLALAADGKPKQRPYRLKYEALQAKLLALTDPGTRGYAVHGLREGKTDADTEIRIRGEAERLGPLAPRGFLTAVAVPNAPKIPAGQSGRLQLALWLTDPANPLTPRVAVNRVWQHLFGTGIVSSSDNFGVSGDLPSHRELLDYLATQFIRDGWSVKRLVRRIVLSRAYRLGSDAPAQYKAIDPANRLVWRHSPRRLDTEEIRDAMLASARRLQLQPPGGSATRGFQMVEIADTGAESRLVSDEASASAARSIYLPSLRGLTPESLEAFDPVTQTLVTGKRDSTTVPSQVLYLLNSAFVRRQSLALAEQLLSDPEGGDARLIRQAYQLALGRVPNPREVARAEQFVAGFEASYRESPVEHVPAPVASPVQIAPETTAAVLDVDQNDIRNVAVAKVEAPVQPKTPREAAWMSFVQSLYASAEFRFVR